MSGTVTVGLAGVISEGYYKTKTIRELLTYGKNNRQWYVGDVSRSSILFNKVGDTSGYGDLLDGYHLISAGYDYDGDGFDDVIFHYVKDRNWFYARIECGQLRWYSVGNTSGFGNLFDGSHTTFAAKFLPSSAAILFNYCHDGKWWLGWIEGSTSAGFSLQWRNVGGTTFGNLSDGNHLNLSGWFSYLKPTSASLLFNYVNDGNW